MQASTFHSGSWSGNRLFTPTPSDLVSASPKQRKWVKLNMRFQLGYRARSDCSSLIIYATIHILDPLKHLLQIVRYSIWMLMETKS